MTVICFHAIFNLRSFTEAILDRLGIATEMKAKLKTYDADSLTQVLAANEVELGVTGIGVILAMPTADFVGPLPKDIQSYIAFTAGVGTSAKDLAASRTLLNCGIQGQRHGTRLIWINELCCDENGR